MTLYPGTQTSHSTSFGANCAGWVWVCVTVTVCVCHYWQLRRKMRKTNRKNINNLFLLIFYWPIGCCHAFSFFFDFFGLGIGSKLICVAFKASPKMAGNGNWTRIRYPVSSIRKWFKLFFAGLQSKAYWSQKKDC